MSVLHMANISGLTTSHNYILKHRGCLVFSSTVITENAIDQLQIIYVNRRRVRSLDSVSYGTLLSFVKK